MAVSKQTRTSAVAAGVVIATAMIAGTLAIPAHAAGVDAAVAPSPTPVTSSSSEILMAGPLFILTGLFTLSIASFIQNALVARLF